MDTDSAEPSSTDSAEPTSGGPALGGVMWRHDSGNGPLQGDYWSTRIEFFSNEDVGCDEVSSKGPMSTMTQ